MSKFGFKLTMFFNNVSNGMKVMRNIPRDNILKSVTTIKLQQPKIENRKQNNQHTNSCGYQKTIGHRKMEMK